MRRPANPLASLIALAMLYTASAPVQAGLRITDDPGTIVLEYGHTSQALAHQDPLPLLRIYGDGVAWVHYPVGTQRAGDYEFRIERKELRRLFRAIQRSGLLEFDRARALQQRRTMQPRSYTVAHTSNEIDTRLRFRLERYDKRSDFDKTIVWTNVDDDARDFPGLSAVQQLARLERTLRAMIDKHPRSPVELPLALR